MNVTVTVTGDPGAFLVAIEGKLANRLDLNKVLAARLRDEMVTIFRAKNSTPNKQGWPRTNFWAKAAEETEIGEVTEEGATVKVGGVAHVGIHLYGGTILPGPGKRALTIPLIAAARGIMARSYERMTGRKLFTIRGRSCLFERTGTAATESVISQTPVRVRGKTRSLTMHLRPRAGIRPVYAFRNSVTIAPDAELRASVAGLGPAIAQEASDWLAMTAADAAGTGGVA